MSEIDTKRLNDICDTADAYIGETQKPRSSLSDHYILCAAIRHGDLVICGRRHMDPVMGSVIRRYPDLKGIAWEQGFLDSKGNYCSREDAYRIAHRAGQLLGRKKHGPAGELFSEDLY